MKPLPPILIALFDHLPPPGSDWPVEQQVAWLCAAEAIFRLVFEAEGRVEILEAA